MVASNRAYYDKTQIEFKKIWELIRFLGVKLKAMNQLKKKTCSLKFLLKNDDFSTVIIEFS